MSGRRSTATGLGKLLMLEYQKSALTQSGCRAGISDGLALSLTNPMQRVRWLERWQTRALAAEGGVLVTTDFAKRSAYEVGINALPTVTQKLGAR